jgi:threonine aldolase
MEMVNLISDTVTRPTAAMLDAMVRAEVGDDVFGQDPTVNDLESFVAGMFGHEAALFCPSGTMTNQIAIKMHTQALDEVICDIHSHIYLYEAGGYSFNAGVAINVLRGDNGILTAGQIRAAIKAETDWYPRSRLIVIENSCNRAGGTYYTVDQVEPILQIAREHKMKMHLDGARLFNVLVETGEKPEDYGRMFDSVSICLSKGLGAPIGSLLTGTRERIAYARRVRKVLGGGMRQAGYLAAAGRYALEHHIQRLRIDNSRAKRAGALLEGKPYVERVLPIMTNIVIFQVAAHLTADNVVGAFKEKGVMVAAMSNDTVRFVFHLDIEEAMITRLEHVIDTLEV